MSAINLAYFLFCYCCTAAGTQLELTGELINKPGCFSQSMRGAWHVIVAAVNARDQLSRPRTAPSSCRIPSYRKDAGTIYTELRANVLRTLLGGYHSTGYFWEQYDDRSGQGLRSHPFTGWTALVVLIMAEVY